MTKPAPAVVRSTQILNYLAERPNHPVTLTEVAQAVGINTASTLSILQALCDTGYLTRHPRHKTYVVGPSLLALGQAARTRLQVADLVDTEVRDLASRFGAMCTGAMVAGDDLVIVSSAGRTSSGMGYPVGMRIRNAAPAGLIFAAWAPENDVRRWLARAVPDFVDAWWERTILALAKVRRDGYSVAVHSDRADKFYSQSGAAGPVQERMDPGQRLLASMLERFAEPIDFSVPRRIGYLGAPVFGPDGEVVVMLSVIGIAEPMKSDSEVAEVGNRLRFSADHITSLIHGRQGAHQ